MLTRNALLLGLFVLFTSLTPAGENANNPQPQTVKPGVHDNNSSTQKGKVDTGTTKNDVSDDEEDDEDEQME